MKFLKKFNELNISTYRSAAQKLNQKGHKSRSFKLDNYANELTAKQKIEDHSNYVKGNVFLNYPDNSLEGYAYLYDKSRKSWRKIGLTKSKISYIGLNTDLMLDDIFGGNNPWPNLDLSVSFNIDLSKLLSNGTFNAYIENNSIDLSPHNTYDNFWSDINITLDSNLKKHSYEWSSFDDIDIVFLLNRKGLNTLNKMTKKYLTDGFGKEIKWLGDSTNNFTNSELYSIPDYLYNLFDLKLKRYMGYHQDDMDQKVIDYDNNFDDYFRDFMEKIKAPSVYYRLYRDEFPDEIKNIGLE